MHRRFDENVLSHISHGKMHFSSLCLLIFSLASIRLSCGLQLSMVASRAPIGQHKSFSRGTKIDNNSRGDRIERKIPSSPGSSDNGSQSSSVSSNLISRLACMALKRRLRSHTQVSCDVSADSNNLFHGRVGPVTVKGRGWQSPLGLTCKALEATVGECKLDMGRVISSQKLVLTTPGAS